MDDNSITQVVNDIDCAWHVKDGKGVVWNNSQKNILELVKYLMVKYKVPALNVVRHYDASRKSCPSSFSKNDWTR